MKNEDSKKNIETIQKTIDKTIHNMEVAEEVIMKTDDARMKQILKDKNENRTEAIECMRKGIKAENLERQERSKYNMEK
ncbi:MAG: small acid-soluble spore protein Tlp [Bacillota bacterium]|nr:small acid-soluble spore protein Tlp [Bacillota bacterium]